MSCRSALLAAITAACLLMPGSSFAESRLALVIGNSAYKAAPPLTNPVNDAKAVADLLRGAGFEVYPELDLTQSDMRRVIGEFAGRVAAKGGDAVAVVYYAGHGVQVGGENFLIPVDAQIRNEADIALQGIRFDDLMNAMEAAPTKARILILDACRNNPFEQVRRTVGRGLAMVNAPVGSVVAYSTSPGTEAEDGQGNNSPFTQAFLAAASEPGIPVEQTFKTVRLAVHNATGGRQTPWEVVSLTGNVSFVPAGAARPVAAAATAEPVTATKADNKPGDGSDAKPDTKAAALPELKPDPEQTSDKPAVRAAYWKKQLRALGAKRAYELVIREDNVDAYREYLALYGTAPGAAKVREISNRRQQMLAWYTAVTANSVASYKYFLAHYASTDMAVMAQTLMARAATRSLMANDDPAALGLQVASTCNCNVAPTRKTEQKRTKKSRPTRNTRRQQYYDDEDDYVVDTPPRVGPPIGGFGIGIGGGMGGFGRPGGGYHGDGPRGGFPSGNRR